MMLVVAALLATGSALRYYLVITLGERVVADLREALFAHVITLSPAFYDRERVGEIISRLTADTTQIKAAFGSSASVALRNFVLFVGATAMMVVTSLRLSGLVLIAIPLIVLPLVAFGRRVTRRARTAQDTLADASAFAVEAIGSVRTVQALTGRTRRASVSPPRSSGPSSQHAIDERARLAHRGRHLPCLREHRRRLVDRRAGRAGGNDDGGNARPVRALCGVRGRRASASCEVWNEVTARPRRDGTDRGVAERRVADPAPARPLALPGRRAATIHFESVTFGYPTRPDAPCSTACRSRCAPARRSRWSAPPAPARARSFQLLLRFYDPVTGRILLDGVPICASRCRTSCAQRIGLVPQDTVIFATSAAREHPLRPARRQRRRGRRRRASGRRRTNSSARCREGYDTLARRARRAALRRPAPAHRDRARDPARPAGAAARRGHQRARRRERALVQGARSRDARAHDAGDRAPARHRAARRPHRRARCAAASSRPARTPSWSRAAASTRGSRRLQFGAAA